MQNQRASLGERFGAAVLDWFLQSVTLIIGWAIWSLIVWKKGQTPGKQIIKLRVVDFESNETASWKQMFKRQALLPSLIISIYVISFVHTIISVGKDFYPISAVLIVIDLIIFSAIVILDFIWFLTGNNRRLVDYWAKTIVIKDTPTEFSN